MSLTPSTPRKPWVAVVLSLFSTGLGHVYSGRIVPGLVLFLLSLLFAPIAVLASWLQASTEVLLVLILSSLGVVAVYLYAACDAYRAARRAGDPYQAREFNTGVVYVLFALVGLTYPPCVAHYLRANVFEAFFIPTASESPNFLPGDHVLVNKRAYQGRAPDRGDVVVFRSPKDRRQTWIKRVIGLPGDTVEVKEGQVILNGKKLERERVPAELLPFSLEEGALAFEEFNSGNRYKILLGPADKKAEDFPKQTVPDGCCFVLGDNRNLSRDSRNIGFVALGEVLGAVQYIYLPAESWGRFGAYRD
jgi:signal peptidase I